MLMFAKFLLISKKQRSISCHRNPSAGTTWLDSGFSRRVLFKMRNHIPAMNLCSQLCKRRKMSKDHQWHRGWCLGLAGHFVLVEGNRRKDYFSSRIKRRPLIYFMLHCIAICVRNRAIRHWKKLMIRSLRQGKPNIIYIIFNILVVISSLERK